MTEVDANLRERTYLLEQLRNFLSFLESIADAWKGFYV